MMIRRFPIAALFVALHVFAVPNAVLLAQSTSVALIPRPLAESHGLTRAWHTQIPVDGDRSKIKHIRMKAGLILIVTDDGTLHVVDAESGGVNWTMSVGERRFVTLGAGANDDFVAAVNGGTLYVMDRASGHLAFRHNTTGTPELGPVLTERHVLVPLVKGPLTAFPLKDNPDVRILGPQNLPAAGRMLNEPATFGNSVVWAGDRNRLFGHQFADQSIDFNEYIRFGVSSGPMSFPPYVFVGTKAGFLVAYDQDRGQRIWEFAAGSPIYHPPVALDKVVYALPQDGGMFAVLPESGEELWYASDPVKFAAASPNRAYTLDDRGRLLVIDAESGARADVMPLAEGVKPIINQETDRIYLFTDGGLIQCLHETQLTEPHRYEPPKPEPPDEKPVEEEPAEEEQAANS